MKNKNVLIAVIGGIVACIVCAGIIFLSPKKENNLKGNDDIPVGDIVTHGSGVGCAAIEKHCDSGTYDSTTNACWDQILSGLSIVDCESQGGEYDNPTGRCLIGSGTTASTWCTECPENAVLAGHLCYSCPDGAKAINNNCYTCGAGLGLDVSDRQCKACSNGMYSPDGDWECHTCDGTLSATGDACYQSIVLTVSAPSSINAGDIFDVTATAKHDGNNVAGTISCSVSGNILRTDHDSCSGIMSDSTLEQDGTSVITVTFTPTDTNTYQSTSATVTVNIDASETDVFDDLGNCTDGLTMNQNTSCQVPTGMQCRVNGGNWYTQNEFIMNSATGVVHLNCTQMPTPSPTPFNCTGLSYSDCQSGAATSYCGWCQGGCKEKSVCATPTPAATPTPTPSSPANVGNCSNGLMLHKNTYCIVPTGLKCNINSGTYVNSGNSINNTTQADVQVACVSSATPTPTATATPKPCVSISGSSSCVARSDCEWDYTNGCHNKSQTCIVPNTYWNGTECISCPNGFTANTSFTRCHIVIPAGSYYSPANGSTSVTSCPAGTYSYGGVYYMDGGVQTNVTTCTACPAGTTSPIGSTSKSACQARTGECSVTVTTTAQRVSPNMASADGRCVKDDRYPDTWTVTVKVNGDGCTGGVLTMGGEGAEKSGGSESHTVTDGQTFNFLYHAKACCTSVLAKATITKDNKIIATGSKSVTVSSGWVKTDSNKCVTASEYNSNPKSYKEADDAAKNVYYIALNNSDPNCVGGRVVDIYHRGCETGGGSSTKYNFCCAKNDGSDYTWYTDQKVEACPSGYTIDNTKNSNTCTTVPIPACYVDSDNGYHWTTDPESSWIKVVGVSRETDCKKDETPACYKDPKGEYKWGKFARVDGYILITSITTEDTCKNEGACYKNAYNDYEWSTTKPIECINSNSCWVPRSNPEVSGTCKYNNQDACEATEGYKVVEGVTKPEACAPEENPACYVHGKSFVWGKYANVSGYIKLDDIDAEVYCKVPSSGGCYKDPDGNYVWGNFEGEKGYKLVPSITDITQCNNDVPTPSTGLDVSKVVYVFMAILMAFGIGFIYYSSIMKKENQ